MTPDAALKHTKSLAARLTDLKRMAVFVGLPRERIGGAIYGDGQTVLSVGAGHEYGIGDLPQRSFLRTPFSIKKIEMNKAIAEQFIAVSAGRIATRSGLNRIGAIATNISKAAFTSKGYGAWADISAGTKARKKSSQVLIDTGILRSSVQYVVRNAST